MSIISRLSGREFSELAPFAQELEAGVNDIIQPLVDQIGQLNARVSQLEGQLASVEAIANEALSTASSARTSSSEGTNGESEGTGTTGGNGTGAGNGSGATFSLIALPNPILAARVSVSPIKELYTQGEAVSLSIGDVSDLFRFTGWSSDDVQIGTSPTLTYTIPNRNSVVVANFERI